MVGIKKKNRDLPPYMARRTYTNKKGEVWVGYYYTPPRDENGKKVAIPLGSDLNEAKKKWAELEGSQFVSENTLSSILKKFFEWASDPQESGLSARTIKDYLENKRFVEPVFGRVKINDIRPDHLMRYFHERVSKIRGKKEVKFLSMIFNWAKARGLSSSQNPASGIIRQMRAPSKRTVYVSDSDFSQVYDNAVDFVRDAMDVAYLTGQRPSDVLSMTWDDVQDNILVVKQAKTGNIVRISVIGQLSDVFARIKNRAVIGRTIICNERGRPVPLAILQRAFKSAREKAEELAKSSGGSFSPFQFRDIRAKAASDSDTQTAAQKLLGHKDITTTTIYRRDRNDVVNPIMPKSLFGIDKKSKKIS